MEGASEAPATMAGDAASCDPPPTSTAPPLPVPACAPAPPAPPSASTKRRWSPSTWRYAIEDSQAELPSRPRAPGPVGAAPAPPSSRTLHSSSQQQPIKAKPPYYNSVYGKAVEEPPRGSYAPRAHSLLETHVRSSLSQPPMKSREVYRKSHHQQHCSKTRACEEEEEEDEEAEADDHDHDDDEGLPMYDDEYFKRRRREMSPSELYFCTICSAKDAETKGPLCAYDNS